jgi:hypothetical protein
LATVLLNKRQLANSRTCPASSGQVYLFEQRRRPASPLAGRCNIGDFVNQANWPLNAHKLAVLL